MDSKQFDELIARLASTASRRAAVKGVVGGTLASVGVTSVASAKKAKSDGKKAKSDGKKAKSEKKGGNNKPKCSKSDKKQKVTICHKGQAITVSKCAYKRGHKKHGDTIKGYGPCPPA